MGEGQKTMAKIESWLVDNIDDLYENAKKDKKYAECLEKRKQKSRLKKQLKDDSFFH